MTDDRSITRLLERWQAGDEDAFAALTPMVYQTLRRLAARHLRSESPGHTWQPTDLVHEAFLQMADADVDWNGRAHFYARFLRCIPPALGSAGFIECPYLVASTISSRHEAIISPTSASLWPPVLPGV